MNLQICFMNETSSDSESAPTDFQQQQHRPGFPCGGSATSSSASSLATSPLKQVAPTRPQVLSLPPLRAADTVVTEPLDEADFFARQARLQTEARMALAQAKEMAHMQMELERQKLKQNPITEMVRSSLLKVRWPFGIFF